MITWRLPTAAFLASMAVGSLTVTVSRAQEEACWTQGATQFVAATHYCVSSVLAPQSGNTYGPQNLADGDPRTAWCEGVRGDGIGESITISIDEGPPFRRLIVSNGYGKSRRVYENNGRIKTVAITSDTGIQTRVNLIDQNGEVPVYLPGLAQRWMKLTILDVYPGMRFTDTCMDFVAPDFVYEEELLQAQQEEAVEVLPSTPDAPEPPPSAPQELAASNVPELEELPSIPPAPEPPSPSEELGPSDMTELEVLSSLPGLPEFPGEDESLEACLKSDTRVTGRLDVYETTHPAGHPITSYLLILSQHTCVMIADQRVEEVWRIQLVPGTDEQAALLKSRIGEELTISGTFVTPHTAWHIGDAVLVDFALDSGN